jgi:hypothetical protein
MISLGPRSSWRGLVYFSSSPVRVTPRRGVQIVSAVYADKKNVGLFKCDTRRRQFGCPFTRTENSAHPVFRADLIIYATLCL